MTQHPSLQFELWNDCNVGCTFCFLGHRPKRTTTKKKLDLLDRVLDRLATNPPADSLALIGGEFWQGQLQAQPVREKFSHVIDHLHSRLSDKSVRAVWLSASLTQAKQDPALWHTLDLFNQVPHTSHSDGFWLTTSFDTIGRFHTKSALKNWTANVQHIFRNYRNVRMNTTMILTQDLISKVNDGLFSFKTFTDFLGTEVNLKPPIAIDCSKQDMERVLPGFFPRRKDFQKFLARLQFENPFIFEKACNIRYRADVLYSTYSQDEYGASKVIHRRKDVLNEIEQTASLPCGHHHSYQAYLDSEACMLCDKLALS